MGVLGHLTPEERERRMDELAQMLERLRPTEEQRRRELDEAFALLDRLRPKQADMVPQAE